MRRAVAIAFACSLVMAGSVERVSATPTLVEPYATEEARVGMCDAFDGVAFTFCVALCEARLCDLRDDDVCVQLRRGFARVSGGALPPCDGNVAEPL